MLNSILIRSDLSSKRLSSQSLSGSICLQESRTLQGLTLSRDGTFHLFSLRHSCERLVDGGIQLEAAERLRFPEHGTAYSGGRCTRRKITMIIVYLVN